ncbi:MAG: hypothetical protein MUP55_03330 [Candidatus Aenigmarchaeota archaeon]|nr:hypothetical protein [Candidatus Aenigmarchaeota archaeon]
MPQHEICELLKENKGKKYSVTDLQHQLGKNKNNINRSLERLIRFGLLKHKFGEETILLTNGKSNYKVKKTIMRVWL